MIGDTFLIVALTAACLVSVGSAESDQQKITSEGPGNAGIDQWHSLKLGMSSPEDVLETLGKPDADKKRDSPFYSPLWGEPGGMYSQVASYKEPRRKITYASKHAINGFNSVELVFVQNKLSCIALEPKSPIPLSEIQRTYGLEFQFWNLSRGDQLENRIEADDAPAKIEATGGYGGSLVALRNFYVTGSKDGNLLGAFAFTITTVARGEITKLQLISRDYIRPRELTRDRPKTETILK